MIPPVLLDAAPAAAEGTLPVWVYQVLIAFLVGLLGWSLQEQIKSNKKAVAELKAAFDMMREMTLKEHAKAITELQVLTGQMDIRVRVAERDISETVDLGVFNERSDAQDKIMNDTLKAVKALDTRKVSYGAMPAARAPASAPLIDERREPDNDSDKPPPMRGRQGSVPGHRR